MRVGTSPVVWYGSKTSHGYHARVLLIHFISSLLSLEDTLHWNWKDTRDEKSGRKKTKRKREQLILGCISSPEEFNWSLSCSSLRRALDATSCLSRLRWGWGPSQLTFSLVFQISGPLALVVQPPSRFVIILFPIPEIERGGKKERIDIMMWRRVVVCYRGKRKHSGIIIWLFVSGMGRSGVLSFSLFLSSLYLSSMFLSVPVSFLRRQQE